MQPTVWVLSDRRYLSQRMPRALADALARLAPGRVVVVEADPLVVEVGGAREGFAPVVGDLVVPRTRNPFALSLLSQVESVGVRSCNTWASIDAVRDKARAALVVDAAGLPAPRTWLADRPSALRRVPRSCFPLLLKPHQGDNARGIVRVHGPGDLDALAWPDGMVLAQSYVDVAGVDVKLYVAGDAVWAVRRPSPLAAGGAFCDLLPVTAALRDLALACRDAFGLTLLGVDVLPSARGPLVVDVNDFPNYTGVDEAPAVIADVLAARLRTAGVAA